MDGWGQGGRLGGAVSSFKEKQKGNVEGCQLQDPSALVNESREGCFPDCKVGEILAAFRGCRKA